jgi:hypothetical protein
LTLNPISWCGNYTYDRRRSVSEVVRQSIKDIYLPF